MEYKSKLKLLIISVLLFAVGGRVAYFFISEKLDASRRPWAYRTDGPVLVGRWTGSVTDPDQVTHTVDMDIFVPQTPAERWKRFNSRRIKKDRSSKTFFDGMALLGINGKQDTCNLWGGLDAPDGHQIHFQLSPVSNVHPPGFNLNLVEGAWRGDTLDLSVTFAWFRPDGSSFSDSADPRYEQKGHLIMVRKR